MTITKSLRAEYKTTPPAHKILANRIAERDPGNAPASGERIGYVYVQALAGQIPSKLQGDRVETPAWIEKHGLKPDYEYYIDHQLYNPIAQLFSIMVENMPGFAGAAPVWATDPDKLIAQREALAGRLLFEEGLSACRRDAKRSFVAKMFAVPANATVSPGSGSSSPRVFRTAPVDTTMAAAEAAAFGAGGGAKRLKQQSIISAFAIDTALMSDERLARDMRAVKRSAKNVKKVDGKTTK